MKILVIGGAGHMGMHMVPMLVSEGYEVAVANLPGAPAPDSAMFAGAKFVYCNSGDENELTKIANAENFEVVIDIPGTAYNTWKVFKDRAEHIIACGSFWMLGKPNVIPTPEIFQNESPFDWAKKRFVQIREILSESYAHKAEFTVILPSNICGPGKIPLDCFADRSAENHKAHMRGEKVYLPSGSDALIMPCDAEDLSRLFVLAVNNRKAAAGQIFNGGTSYALTMTQFVKTYAKIYNTEIPIEYIPWDEYLKKINPNIGAWWHFYADMCPDITKARQLLGYKPKYTSEQAMERAVNWMREQKILD